MVLWTRAYMHLVMDKVVVSLVAHGLCFSWAKGKPVRRVDIVAIQMKVWCAKWDGQPVPSPSAGGVSYGCGIRVGKAGRVQPANMVEFVLLGLTGP